MTNKRRPTVGDKVRILSVMPYHKRRGFYVGQVHTIDKDEATYMIGGAWFMEERVELVEDETDQHAPGAKLDAGKPRVALVLGGFSRALMAVSEVGTFGANKYSDNGWKSVENGLQRYSDALGRHLLKEAGGELTDDESGLLHAAHAAWNALARLELILREEK